MRFESLMWAALALLLAGTTVWNEAASVQPLQTEEQLEARDGGNSIPPGP